MTWQPETCYIGIISVSFVETTHEKRRNIYLRGTFGKFWDYLCFLNDNSETVNKNDALSKYDSIGVFKLLLSEYFQQMMLWIKYYVMNV